MNTKKLSAPGRRASNRPRATFKADKETTDTVITEINATTTTDATDNVLQEKQQQEQEELEKVAREKAEQLRQEEEEAAAAAASRRKAEKEEQQAAKAAAQQEDERQRLADEVRRQAEAEAEADRIAQEEFKQAAKEKLERKRSKEEARRQAEEDAEAEEQAAYEEKLARDKAERQRQREVARQQAEENERVAEQQAVEAQVAQEKLEALRLEDEARRAVEAAAEREEEEKLSAEKAERQRLKAVARRLAEEEAERAEQAAFEEKLAADKAERQRVREAAAQKKAEEEEIARREAEELAARRKAEEEAIIQAAQVAAQEELARENQAAEDQARLEEEAQQLQAQQQREEEESERLRLLAVAQQEEEARLASVRAKAAAERKKRSAFLDDMDTFSSTFEQSQSEKETARQKAEEESVAMLTGTIASASSAYVSTAASERSEEQRLALREEEESKQRQRHEEKVLSYERQAALDAKEEADRAVRLKAEQQQQLDEEIDSPTEAGPDFQDLTSSLFKKEEDVPRPPVASKSDLFGNFNDDDDEDEKEKQSNLWSSTLTASSTKVGADEGDDVLSMPKIDRVVTVKRKGQKQATAKEQEQVPFTATDNDIFGSKDDATSSHNGHPDRVTPHSLVKSDVLGKFSDDEEDDCDEDLTKEQRVAWRAKQEDLHAMRKDFHGAVTYAFGGCFSWQMYSAVDAVDEHGKSYTEYLMRCQWGTNWENMQPWLVARRFREFDTLNDLLLQHYPNAKQKMHPLPKKQFFGSLDAATVEQRTKDIEAYVATIVTNLPSMLKSRYFDGFFSIQERISQIRKQIEEEKLKNVATVASTTNLYDGVVPLAPGTVEELGSSSKEGDAATTLSKVKMEKLEVKDLLTVEEVEAQCEEQGVRGFDDDELGRAEERIRDFRHRLTKTPTKYLAKDAKVRRQLMECQALWPRLHLSCRIGSDVVDSMLIARAMQAEEDLEGALKELRSFLKAQSMGSPLHC